MQKPIRANLFCFLMGAFLFLAPSTSMAKKSKAEGSLPLEDLQRFTTIVDYVRTYYVKEEQDSTLFDNAIKGMLASLDPHSAYLDPDEFNELKMSTSGKFGGLGIEVTMEEGLLKIISPIDDTPAQKAGLQPADLIFKIDGTPVKGLSIKDAIDKMRGEPGTPIVLSILRKSSPKPLDVRLKRAIINVKSVKQKMIAPNYGYVRVSQFQSRTGEEFVQAIKKMVSDNKNGELKGVILDLRNNPGGVFESAVTIADAFLDRPKLKLEGLIVYTQGRIPEAQLRETAKNGDLLKGTPLIVLINGGSASASEIVAGALQDHKRAILLGTKSFGKGSVQTVLALKGENSKKEYGIKLTTALYFTPSGRSIQATGIEPDIEVQPRIMPEKKPQEDNPWGIREQELKGHLNNGNAPQEEEAQATTEDEEVTKKPEQTAVPVDDTLAQDFQVQEALNLLKGLAILEK